MCTKNCENAKKKAGGSDRGGQVGCVRRIEVIVKMQKKVGGGSRSGGVSRGEGVGWWQGWGK